jgi:hypothetical protein
MSKRLFELVDGYAAAQGIKRSAVVVQALEQFFGMQKQIVSPTDFARTRNILPTTAFHTPETTIMQEETGDICELPVPGSSPAQTPVHYQKGTGQKS